MKVTRHFLMYCARYTSYAKINPNNCNDEKLKLMQSYKDRVVKVIAVLLFIQVSLNYKLKIFFFVLETSRLGNSIVFLCLDVRNFFVEVFCEKSACFYVPFGCHTVNFGSLST